MDTRDDQSEWPFEAGDEIEGRYHIVRPLAKGGIGAIYEATHNWSGLRVALKVLFRQEKDYAQRMQAEARALAKISHPNVVPISDGGVTTEQSPCSGVVWIAMQLLEGRNLREELNERGALELARALRFGVQIADGCAAAHALDVVHRDLKPENVFVLEADDTIKILDFGVSKIRNKLRPVELRTTDRLRVLGTQAYAAPEALQAGRSDARSDVYAVGHILYEMFAGRHCWSEGDGPLDLPAPMELGLRQIFTEPRSVVEFAPDVPDYVNAIVMRALAKEPDARQQSMAELSSDLSKALTRVGAPAARSPSDRTGANVDPAKNRSSRKLVSSHASGPVPIGGAEPQVSMDAALVCGAARFACASPELTDIERGMRTMAAVEGQDRRFRGLLRDLASGMAQTRPTVLASHRHAFGAAGLREGVRVGYVLNTIRRTALEGGWKPGRSQPHYTDRIDLLRGAAVLLAPEHLSDAANNALKRMAQLDEDTRNFAFSVLVAFARTPSESHPAPRGALLALALGGPEDSELARAELAKFVLSAASTRDLGVETESIDLSDDPNPSEEPAPAPPPERANDTAQPNAVPAPSREAARDQTAHAQVARPKPNAPPAIGAEGARFDPLLAFAIALTAATCVGALGWLLPKPVHEAAPSPPVPGPPAGKGAPGVSHPPAIAPPAIAPPAIAPPAIAPPAIASPVPTPTASAPRAQPDKAPSTPRASPAAQPGPPVAGPKRPKSPARTGVAPAPAATIAPSPRRLPSSGL